MIKRDHEIIEEAASSQDPCYRELVTEARPDPNDVGSNVQTDVVEKRGSASRADNPTQGRLGSIFNRNTDCPADIGVKKTIRGTGIYKRLKSPSRGRMSGWIVQLHVEKRKPERGLLRKSRIRSRERPGLVVDPHPRPVKSQHHRTLGVQSSGVLNRTGSDTPFSSALAAASSKLDPSATTRLSSSERAIHRSSGALSRAFRRSSEFMDSPLVSP
jgi:hypothetical protein